jgi:hypothetical protein
MKSPTVSSATAWGALLRLLAAGLFMFPGLVRATDCTSLDTLAWITGQWESLSTGSRISETWTRVSELSFEGLGEVRTVPGGELKSREALRLVSMSGQLYYIAKVAHNALPVAFALTECGGHSAVFENTNHDFPTRIAYQLTDTGQMVVDVQGPDGKGFSIRFEAVAAGQPQSSR